MKVDYQKTIIYKLCCRDVNVKEIYVGHTTNFKLRNQQHKNVCNNLNSKNNRYIYKVIRENGGYENFYMIKIKDYPCKNKRDAEAEENRLMIELGATLNSRKSYRTEDEKKEQQKEYDKKYYENNKDKISQKGKDYYENNKDIINEKTKFYYEQNKNQLNEKQKQYYQENKDKINEKNKKHYQQNKDIINEKITCEKCGAVVSIQYLKQHQKRDTCIKKSECLILDD